MGWFRSFITGCNSACEAAKREEVRQFDCQTAYKMSCEAWADKQAGIKKENERIEAANKAAKLAQEESDRAGKAAAISEQESKKARARNAQTTVGRGFSPQSQLRARSKIFVPKIGIPGAMRSADRVGIQRKRLKSFSADDSDFGNVNDLYGMKRGGVTMASRRGDGAAIRGKTRAGMK